MNKLSTGFINYICEIAIFFAMKIHQNAFPKMVKKSIYGSGCPRNLLFTPK